MGGRERWGLILISCKPVNSLAKQLQVRKVGFRY